MLQPRSNYNENMSRGAEDENLTAAERETSTSRGVASVRSVNTSCSLLARAIAVAACGRPGGMSNRARKGEGTCWFVRVKQVKGKEERCRTPSLAVLVDRDFKFWLPRERIGSTCSEERGEGGATTRDLYPFECRQEEHFS